MSKMLFHQHYGKRPMSTRRVVTEMLRFLALVVSATGVEPTWSAVRAEVLDQDQLNLATSLLTDALACHPIRDEENEIRKRSATTDGLSMSVSTRDINSETTATFSLTDISETNNDSRLAMVLLCKTGNCISVKKACVGGEGSCRASESREHGQRYVFCNSQSRENARFALDVLFKHQNEILANSR